jgi:uncharacterized membrane protein YeiH
MKLTLVQTLLEHAGTSVSAISGVLAAKGKRIDLFGVLVLALVTAFGGGTTRDLLVGDAPVAWLRGPQLLLNATITALLTFAVARAMPLPRRALIVADAGALAIFAILGTTKGLAFHFSAPVAILLGVVTGIAGGIVRDVLTGEVPLVFRPEIRLYATAAFVGSTIFVVLTSMLGTSTAMLLGAGTVFALRLAAMRWKLSLPIFDTRE